MSTIIQQYLVADREIGVVPPSEKNALAGAWDGEFLVSGSPFYKWAGGISKITAGKLESLLSIPWIVPVLRTTNVRKEEGKKEASKEASEEAFKEASEGPTKDSTKSHSSIKIPIGLLGKKLCLNPVMRTDSPSLRLFPHVVRSLYDSDHVNLVGLYIDTSLMANDTSLDNLVSETDGKGEYTTALMSIEDKSVRFFPIEGTVSVDLYPATYPLTYWGRLISSEACKKSISGMSSVGSLPIEFQIDVLYTRLQSLFHVLKRSLPEIIKSPGTTDIALIHSLTASINDDISKDIKGKKLPPFDAHRESEERSDYIRALLKSVREKARKDASNGRSSNGRSNKKDIASIEQKIIDNVFSAPPSAGFKKLEKMVDDLRQLLHTIELYADETLLPPYKKKMKEFLALVDLDNMWYVDKSSGVPIACEHYFDRPRGTFPLKKYAKFEGKDIVCINCGEVLSPEKKLVDPMEKLTDFDVPMFNIVSRLYRGGAITTSSDMDVLLTSIQWMTIQPLL
jgi:hypothetical protein